jgi:hypothetical protein
MRKSSDYLYNTEYTPTKISKMLKEYFDENGMKQSEIAKELDVTQSAVCNQLSGRPFGRNSATLWSTVFGFDMGWLMTGEGEIFRVKKPQYILPADKNRFINKTTDDPNTLLPVIPAWMFRAPNINVIESVNSKSYKAHIEHMPIVRQFRTHDIFARCPGDAMSPKICKGNIVAMKQIDIDSVNYVIPTIYGVNINSKGFILRKIRDNKDGTLTCIPINLDKFDPFDINRSDVIECFEVVGVLNDNI